MTTIAHTSDRYGYILEGIANWGTAWRLVGTAEWLRGYIAEHDELCTIAELNGAIRRAD